MVQILAVLETMESHGVGRTDAEKILRQKSRHKPHVKKELRSVSPESVSGSEGVCCPDSGPNILATHV